MQLTVKIHRQKPDERAPGTLKAYVIGNGRTQGPNILRAGLRNVDEAKEQVRAKVNDMFAKAPGSGPPSILFEIDDHRITDQQPPEERTA